MASSDLELPQDAPAPSLVVPLKKRGRKPKDPNAPKKPRGPSKREMLLMERIAELEQAKTQQPMELSEGEETVMNPPPEVEQKFRKNKKDGRAKPRSEKQKAALISAREQNRLNRLWRKQVIDTHRKIMRTAIQSMKRFELEQSEMIKNHADCSSDSRVNSGSVCVGSTDREIGGTISVGGSEGLSVP